MTQLKSFIKRCKVISVDPLRVLHLVWVALVISPPGEVSGATAPLFQKSRVPRSLRIALLRTGSLRAYTKGLINEFSVINTKCISLNQ